MANYRPRLTNLIPMLILNPTHEVIHGVNKKTYPTREEAEEDKHNIFQGTFRTFGGTERSLNNLFIVEDTASIETWYRPDITTDTKILNLRNGKIYDVVNVPESANQKDQILSFKVKWSGGKA